MATASLISLNLVDLRARAQEVSRARKMDNANYDNDNIADDSTTEHTAESYS